MAKPKVSTGILALLTPNVTQAECLIGDLYDELYDDKRGLMLKLGNLRTRGKAIMDGAQQAIDELGEV